MRDELRSIAADLHTWLAWDLEEDLPGYGRSAGEPAAATDTAPGVTTPPTPRPQAAPAAAPSSAAVPTPAATLPDDLDGIRLALGDCHRCKLSGLGRSTIVFGEGDPNADLLFAGEGPGYHEDQQGRPFVGQAGELLDRMIGAMGLRRQDVYICNVVKCRPPGNRDPEPDEVLACQPFLRAQIRSVRPRAVVALGRFAAQCLLETNTPLGRLRGRFHDYLGVPLMPTFHPAYLLRTPEDKRIVWEDLQKVMDLLGLERPR